MNAKLICYDMSKLNQIEKVEIKRALFGHTEYSNNAKYTYKREGILDKIPSLKPIKAVIIVKNGDEKPILNILKKYGAKYYQYDVDIPKLKSSKKCLI
jgi:hypothetical protein